MKVEPIGGIRRYEVGTNPTYAPPFTKPVGRPEKLRDEIVRQSKITRDVSLSKIKDKIIELIRNKSVTNDYLVFDINHEVTRLLGSSSDKINKEIIDWLSSEGFSVKSNRTNFQNSHTLTISW
ncbi:transcriptional regulatory protein [Pectobacterium phage POP12]|nr:transcriptional regulatory protein [Pectobacterium phage POP12]